MDGTKRHGCVWCCSQQQILKLSPFLFRIRRTLQHASHGAPLRAELFSADQMEQHGKAWRRASRSPSAGPTGCFRGWPQNERVLVDICDLLTTAIKASRRITPAAEWLLDNFYLIEEADPHCAAAPAARATAASCRAWPSGPSAGHAARLRHRAGGRSPMATAGSTRNADALRRGVPDRHSRSSSASCGRSRSCCAWR